MLNYLKRMAMAASLMLPLFLPGAVVPETVEVGEVTQYTMELPGEPDLPLPFPKVENAEWVVSQTSRQIGYSNLHGQITRNYRLTVGLRALKPGTIKIPAWSVKVDGKTVDLPAAELKALPAGEKPVAADEKGSIPLKEAVFGEVTIPDGLRRCYAGEEIPLEISCYMLRDADIRPVSYPTVSGMGDAVFHDYGKENRESRQFAPPRRRLVDRDGRVYEQFMFSTAFRAVRPGVIEPAAKLIVAVPEQSGRPSRRSAMSSFFDDDFFSFAAPRYRQIEIVCNFPGSFEVKPLPPPPADAIFTGLVGKWKLAASLDRKSVPAGEAVTLELVADGKGGVDGVAAPKLEIPGFRVYPGEVKSSNSGDRSQWLVKYAAIPLRENVKAPALRFSWFDVASGKYEIYDFAPELVISAPLAAASAAVFDTAVPAAPTETRETEKPSPVREELFSPKPEAGVAVKLPLWRNQLPWLPLVLIFGLAIALLLEIRLAWRRRLDASPELRRLRELRSRRTAVCAAIRQAPDDRSFLAAVHAEATPYAAAALGLPPGATPAELAKYVKDPELRELFSGGEDASFMPGAPAAKVKLTPVLRRKLLRFVKSLALLVGFGVAAVSPLHGAEGLNDAYYAADYRKAAAQYEAALQDRSAQSPALLYNLGSALYQLGDLPRAKYCFEMALLLDPTDQETLENLNLVNRKLAQPECGSAGTPLELLLWCRDRLRPDQYLMIAAVALVLLALGVPWRDALGRKWFWITSLGFASVAVIAAAALLSELGSNYSSSRAVVTAKTLELRTLPAAGAGRVEASIPGGADARVVERRGDWLRIEVNGREGWCNAAQVSCFFPDGALF